MAGLTAHADSGDLALAIGITDYQNPSVPDLESGAEEVAIALDAFARLGFRRSDPLVGAVSPTDVGHYLAQVPNATRRLVLYWTGHGSSGPEGSWLFTSGTDPDQLGPANALSAAALARMLHGISGPAQIVVVLDCCGAGAAALDVAKAVVGLPAPRQPGRRPASISFITATYGDEEAQPLIFAEALASALQTGPPSTSWVAQKAMVNADEVAEAVALWLRINQAPEGQHASSVGLSAGTDFFRNPVFDPHARDVLVDASMLVRRQAVLSSISDWITATRSGIYLLTGSMGTGKSSIVAQLGAESRTASPAGPPQLITVNAAQRGLQDLSMALGLRLGLPPAVTHRPEDLVSAWAAVGRPITIVADALDEAKAGQRRPIVQRLLTPLALLPGVHVVVADRGGAGDWMAPELADLRSAASGSFDLDSDPDAAQDITRHVLRILTATPASPYRDDLRSASAVAEAVASGSDGIFYLADSVATVLARSPDAVSADGPQLKRVLRAGLQGAIQQDLARIGARSGLVQPVLSALAWSLGPGLPLDAIWPAMVSALRPDGSPALDQTDIETVLEDAGSYVVASPHNGRLRYRLRHQAIGEFLRSETRFDEVSVQRRISDALRPALGTWSAADDYVIDHLAEHAFASGSLAELFEDPDFMIYSDPRATLAVATRARKPDRSDRVDFYLQAGSRLIGVPVRMRDFVFRSVELESGADARTPGIWAAATASTPSPCRPRWITGRHSASHRLIRSGPDSVESFSVVRTSGGIRLATATRTVEFSGNLGGIEIWDPTLVLPEQIIPAKTDGDQVWTMNSVLSDIGGEVLIAAYHNGTLEALDVANGQSLWKRNSADVDELWALRSQGDRLIASTTEGSPIILLASTDTGAVVGRIRPSNPVRFLLSFPVRNFTILCIGTTKGDLEFFDADRRDLLGRVKPDVMWVQAVALVLDGRPTLCGARDDGRLELRDGTDGRLLSLSKDYVTDAIYFMCLLDAGSADPLVATASGEVISLWNVRPLHVGSTITGHSDGITGIHPLPDETGEERLVSAAKDGTVRIWQGVDRQRASSSLAEKSFERVFPTILDGSNVVLAVELSEFSVLRASDGSAIKSFPKRDLTDADGPSPDLTKHIVWGVVTTRSETLALTEHEGHDQFMWGLTNRDDYAVPTPAHGGRRCRRVVLARPDGPLLVVGRDDEKDIPSAERFIGVYTFAGALLTRLDAPADSWPCLAIPHPAGDLVLVQSADAFTILDPMTGEELHRVPITIDLPEKSPGPTALAAMLIDGEATVLYLERERAAWLARSTGPPVRVIRTTRPRLAAAVVQVDDQQVIAFEHRDRVLIVRPGDGSIAAEIPFIGKVWDVAAAGPGSLCVVASNRVHWLDLSAGLLQESIMTNQERDTNTARRPSAKEAHPDGEDQRPRGHRIAESGPRSG